jgi:hypothetical protein
VLNTPLNVKGLYRLSIPNVSNRRMYVDIHALSMVDGALPQGMELEHVGISGNKRLACTAAFVRATMDLAMGVIANTT